MKYNSLYNNFGSGELSRSLFGRTDIEEYFRGASDITNFLITRQGGASFRPGTVAALGVYSTSSQIITFSPRDNENYVVVLQPGRPIQVTDQEGISCSVTQDTYPWNERPDFTDSAVAYNFPSDDVYHRELTQSLQYATSSDTMVIVDGTGRLAPIVLLRTDVSTFVVDSFINPRRTNPAGGYYISPPFGPLRVPYKDQNYDTDLRLKPSAVSGNITITAQNAAASPVDFFQGDVVGMWIKIKELGTTDGTGVAYITSKTSDSVVQATTIASFVSTTAQFEFEVSAWNPHDGYPKSVCFYEGRLVFGGNKNFPDMMWLSRTGNIYHFMQRRLVQDKTDDVSGLNYFGNVTTADPFNFIPAAVGANSIQWIYPSDSLLVGTTENEFSVSGGQENFLSVSSIFVKPISSHGSSKIQPVKVGSSVLFISLDGKRVLEIPKRLVEYTSASDWTSIAAGIVEKAVSRVTSQDPLYAVNSKITNIAWDETFGILWCVCNNGYEDTSAIVTLTIDKTTKVLAWSKQEIKGLPHISSLSVGNDDNNPGNKRVKLFLKREGATYFSVEDIAYGNDSDSFQPHPVDPISAPLTTYLDCSLAASTDDGYISVDSTAYGNRFPSGLEFGVIKVVRATGVGTYLGEFPYTDTGSGSWRFAIPGVIADDYLTYTYIVGLVYSGEIKTMPIEAGAQFGVAQGSARRTHEISVYVDRSLGGKYKASKSANEFGIVESKGTPEALYTGEVKLSLNASPNDHQIVLKQDVPYPLNILWLLTKGYTYDA